MSYLVRSKFTTASRELCQTKKLWKPKGIHYLLVVYLGKRYTKNVDENIAIHNM